MLIGNSINQLEQATDLIPGDIFLISETSIYDNTKRESKFIRCQDFVCNVSSSVLDHFGTMVYEQSSDYCLTSHNHNDKYNAFGIKYYFTPDPSRDISIGQYFLDGVLSTLYMPLSGADSRTYIVRKSNIEPSVGSVKFHTAGNLDESTGWVLADGKQYTSNQYEHEDDLNEIYGNGDGTFNVPKLSNFIKIDNYNRDSYPEVQPQHVYTPNHNDGHTIDISISGKVEISASISCSSAYGHGLYAHNGKDAPEKPKIVTSGQFSIKMKPQVSVTNFSLSAQEINNDVYPNHYAMAAYVYIGGKV